jgi:hypothetical protein
MGKGGLGLLAFIALIFAGVCGLFLWQDWKIYSRGTPTPESIALDDLAARGAKGNLHVTVTHYFPGQDSIVEEKGKTINRVWVPLRGPSDNQIKLIVKSFNFKSNNDIRQFTQRGSVTGIITNDIHSLGSAEQKELEKAYPGVNFSNMLILEEGRDLPTKTKMYVEGVGAGVMAVFALVCILMMFVVKKREPGAESPEVLGIDPEAEGLGRQEGGFSGAATGQAMMFGSVGALLLIGGFGAFLLTHTKPEELLLGYCFVGAMALVCVFFFCLGVRKLGYRLALFENGLVETRGKAARIFRWSDVDAIRGMVLVFFNRGPAYMGGPMVIRRRDGATLKLAHGIANLEALVGAITERIMAHMLPAALDAIRGGGSIQFDTLWVAANGFTRQDGVRLAWAEFADFSITPDTISIMVVKQHSPWWKHSLGSLWNARLLLDLTAQLRGR